MIISTGMSCIKAVCGHCIAIFVIFSVVDSWITIILTLEQMEERSCTEFADVGMKVSHLRFQSC